ncbi:aromatic ring-hydroxylating dioxygenase subunit alpha [Actinoplanes sp. NPDC051851]|uniref:aromatic ring-hydroxylating oxygenase subunit alpha n=1 Tax=Actinoplanes sp. NPDC051851 TaxID=3154753 RepID=UPI003439F6E2
MTSVQEHAAGTTFDEVVDTSKVPFRVENELLIPTERYYHETFFEAEKKLWKKWWQHACHETEIPRPGDFTEYQILDQSIVLVRQQDGSVRGFHNACRHRGTALACGSGTFRRGEMVCPFHGWRWNLAGKNTYVYAKDGFRDDTVEQDDIDLPEVQVALRWGFVWINLDPHAPSLEESTHGIGAALDPNDFERMHVNWWHQVEFDANWKVAQEAFFEAYHVMQAHPEMACFLKNEDFNALSYGHYRTDPQGHGWADMRAPRRFVRPGQPLQFRKTDPAVKTEAELFYASAKAMWEGSQAQTNAHYVAIIEQLLEELPRPHDGFFPEFGKRVYRNAAERGVRLPAPNPDVTGHFAMYPNFTGVSLLGCALVYRSRPHPSDPNKCIYDFWGLEIPPEGTPVRRPKIAADDAPTWDELWFVQQDASNIERMQTGLRTSGLKHIRLGVDVEQMIINWHRALDRELAKVL